jgi:hypothetical protein
MQIAGKPLRVKLKVDLTKYDNRCIEIINENNEQK